MARAVAISGDPLELPRGYTVVKNNVIGPKVNLSGADFIGADLEEANLEEANLEGANLTNANLSGINFSGAKLNAADLSGSNLEGASFIGADLDMARAVEISGDPLELPQGHIVVKNNIIGPKLNLIGVDFSEANFEGANLEGANL